MATATRKKSAAYEQGVREGRADKSKKAPMEMEKGEGKAHESAESPDEESSEGPEPDDAPRFGSRKRSAKDAKNTKAPMDAECGATPGKKCSACKSGKPCSGRAMKDAGCGMKKLDSALTPHEYLAACDLGIQDKPRSYIRARLDVAKRLDKKCGSSGIPDNAKCSKGTESSTSKAKKSEPTFSNKLQAGFSGLSALYSGVTAAQNIGLAVQHRSVGHAVAGLGNLGGAVLGAKASSEFSKGKENSGNLYSLGAYGSNVAGQYAGTAIAESDFRRRQANSVVNKPYDGPDPYKALGLGKNATIREARAAYLKVSNENHPDKGGDGSKFKAAKEAYEELVKRNKGRRDSIWASGLGL